MRKHGVALNKGESAAGGYNQTQRTAKARRKGAKEVKKLVLLLRQQRQTPVATPKVGRLFGLAAVVASGKT